MKYNKFMQEVAKRVQEKTGRETRVETIKKNNGVNMDGLVVQGKGKDISPVVYLAPYYRFYLESGDMARIVNEIYRYCLEDSRADDFDISKFKDFEQAKPRIVYRLVNYEKNRLLLKEVPYRKHMDLAAVFCFLAHDAKDMGQASILIRNEHLAFWNASADDVAGAAYENTPGLLGYDFVSMGQMIGGSCKGRAGRGIPEADISGLPKMTILTNRSRLNGAACILYPGILKEFADKINSNLAILPCSIHEVILVPIKGDRIPDREGFCRMICEVNESEVDDTEVLSDHPYFYNRRTAQLSAA